MPDSPNGFDVVLRGYDRTQVDARISDLLRQLAAATEQVQLTAAQLGDEQHRADLAERRLREALERPGAPAPPKVSADPAQGFGYRAERMLRAAEAEAHEIRAAAANDAAQLMERARAEAEMHRHEIEQNLIMRATELDQKANEVAAALRDREQAVAAELTSARAEAEAVRAAARQEMEQARKNLEIVARDVRAQAERWAAEHRAAATREVARLVGLHDTMYRDLDQLKQALLTGLRGEAGTDGSPDTEEDARTAELSTTRVPSSARGGEPRTEG